LKGRHLCAAVVLASLPLYPLVPLSAAAAPAGVTQVHWHRNGLLTWERVEHRAIAPPTIRRSSLQLAPGESKVVTPGAPGEVEIRLLCAQRGGGPVRHSVLAKVVVRLPKARIVADGVGGSPLARFEARGLAQMALIARNAIEMLATAYTAGSAGGGGMTAIGRRAGYGIVAVDPRVIPLGTRLYITGYGFAVAGDTGGDIVGHRVDLGFDTLRDAMLFGRRVVTVYRLK
jgi:3D (Asp-Asp-Asp) domain-containing protein